MTMHDVTRSPSTGAEAADSTPSTASTVAGDGQVHKLAQQHLLPHFTPGKAWLSDSLGVIERAEGCYVYDVEGRVYLDGLAGLFCTNLGHGRADLAEAGAAIRSATDAALAKPETRTADLGGALGTAAFGAAVVGALS